MKMSLSIDLIPGFNWLIHACVYVLYVCICCCWPKTELLYTPLLTFHPQPSTYLVSSLTLPPLAPTLVSFQIERFTSHADAYTEEAGRNLLRTLCWLLECVSGSLLSHKDRNTVFREYSQVIDSVALFLMPDAKNSVKKMGRFQAQIHARPTDPFALAHLCNTLKHLAVVFFSQDGAKRVRAWPKRHGMNFFTMLKMVN